MRESGWARPGRIVCATVIAAVAAITVAPPAAGADGGKRELTVMTQNLYLGSSLQPALDAENTTELVLAVAEIYGTAVFTNFTARAEAIADEIATERPDLIGLQEVSNWTATALVAGADPPDYDFLTILLDALAARDLHYTAASTSDNADIGPVPLIAPAFGCGLTATDCVVSLQDRDVILVNEDTPDLSWSKPTAGNFTAQETVDLPDGSSLSFDRGWASIEARYGRTKFRFVNTHLEVEDFASTQEQQARELIAGPLRTDRPVILVGDLNSPADGSTTDSHRLIVKAWFADAWWVNLGKPGATCCQNSTLTNTKSELKSRIDFVFTRWAIPTGARLVGTTPFHAQPPLWPSDHAGVVATVHLL